MGLLRTVAVAHATLDAIDAAIDADDGGAWRQHLGRVIAHAEDAYRGQESGHRGHLGASLVGGECARSIWYSFRWAHKAKHEPRMMRLFNRGHLEEPRFVAMLLAIGCEVWQHDADGHQFRVAFAEGHGGGSGDGVARGFPELPGTPALCEFKTHGLKSFTKLAGKPEDWRAYRAERRGPFPGEGVRGAKFEHFVQMQVYMRRMQLPAAVYMAVCKDTDDLYAEVVQLEPEVADQYINRGELIAFAAEPPKRVSESPGFWKCRFCDKRPICYLNAEPSLNCRTCRHSVPGKAGTWHCTLHRALLDKERQAVGCTDYAKLPSL